MADRVGVDPEALAARPAAAARRAPAPRFSAASMSSTVTSRWNCCGRAGSGQSGGAQVGRLLEGHAAGAPGRAADHHPVVARFASTTCMPSSSRVEGGQRTRIGAVDHDADETSNHDVMMPGRVRRKRPNAQTSASRRPASRQAASTARAYSGVAPARPHAGVTTTCCGSRAAREAEPRPQRCAPGRRPAADVGARPAGRGRVGAAPANRPEPGVDRLAERVEVVDQRQVERDGGGPGVPDRPAAARPARSSARPPARRPPRSPSRSAARPRRRRRPRGSALQPALGRHPPGQHRRQRRLVELQQHRGARAAGARTSATCRRSPSASESVRSRTAPWSRSSRPPIGRSSAAASVHGPAACTLSGPA